MEGEGTRVVKGVKDGCINSKVSGKAGARVNLVSDEGQGWEGRRFRRS